MDKILEMLTRGPSKSPPSVPPVSIIGTTHKSEFAQQARVVGVFDAVATTIVEAHTTSQTERILASQPAHRCRCPRHRHLDYMRALCRTFHLPMNMYPCNDKRRCGNAE